MAKFSTLTVAEQGYESDLLTGVMTNSTGAYLSVAIKYERRPRLIIRQAGGLPGGKHLTEINFKEVDLDGLIELLSEARTFIKEEEMVAKLRG